MIKINELKEGDYVMADFEGQIKEGVVTELNHEDKEICVKTNVQTFWFKPENLYPIALDESQLLKLGFEKEAYENNYTKFKKGPFRVLLNSKGFDDFEIWYREDHRQIKMPIAVHQLQNHYLQMTKVELV
jgi:hypothetical protein